MSSATSTFVNNPDRLAHRILPRELTVITTDLDGSRDLFTRLEQAHHLIRPVAWTSPAMSLNATHSQVSLLDLPGIMDTRQALIHLRQLQTGSPTILLAEESVDPIPLLEANALDVLSRRASPIVQLTRIAAHWRRGKALQHHSPGITPLPRSLSQLPHGERRLLGALIAAEEAVPRRVLRRAVGRNNTVVSNQEVTQLVYGLNRRLQPFGIRIQAVWGIGYKLESWPHLPA